jgi:hypothetical protein
VSLGCCQPISSGAQKTNRLSCIWSMGPRSNSVRRRRISCQPCIMISFGLTYRPGHKFQAAPMSVRSRRRIRLSTAERQSQPEKKAVAKTRVFWRAASCLACAGMGPRSNGVRRRLHIASVVAGKPGDAVTLPIPVTQPPRLSGSQRETAASLPCRRLSPASWPPAVPPSRQASCPSNRRLAGPSR